MPFLGTYITWSPVKFLTFLEWNALSAGSPDNPSTKINFFFHDLAVFLNIKNVTISYVYEKFIEEEILIPGISLRIPINNEFTFSVGADYKYAKNQKTRDRGVKDEPLFHIGLSYSPKR